VLLLVNVYLMVILCRHRRQLRGLGVRPVSSSRRRRLRHPASPAEAEGFVERGNGRLPASASPELSRRAGAHRPRPAPLAASPFQPTTPTSPPGRVHLPPRDSPVFVHVESPRESPLLGRVPPGAAVAPELLPQSVDVSPPPSLREESPIWVRLQEAAAASDATLAPPGEPRRTAVESPVWVHLAFDDSPSTTASTTTPAAVPAAHPSSSAVSPLEVAPSRAAGPPLSAPLARVEPQPPVATLTRSYSNPYRQDTYRTADRAPARTPQRPRQRRLLRFD